MDKGFKGKAQDVADAVFQWLSQEVKTALDNPKTTSMGVAVWATIPALKPWSEKVAAFLTGWGLVHAHDGNKGSSKPTEDVNKAVEQVKALDLPAPPTKQ